ncbi:MULTISPECIES: hypothetical protein [Haloarcula]|uniref:hypothetical protein n=1 Tax=Haloarcula TaxID=2237 RepID=UPI0023EA8A26|nr:hypothetical protein [Halomicroarcula sp. XH51]
MSASPPLTLLLVACLAVTAGCSFFGPNPDSYTSTYEYSVGVDANETLRNVTVRVPLPLVDGESPVDAGEVAPNGTFAADFDSGGQGAGETFDASVVETERGPMLELTTERLTVETRYFRYVEEDGLGRQEEISEAEYDPENPDHAKRDRRTVARTISVDATYPIETRDPVGVSPTLYGEGVARDLTECTLPYHDEAVCYRYDAPVYLDYKTSDDALVESTVSVTGANEWFTGGWTGNDYQDRVHARATGPQDGWITASGYTETGRGNYPSPEP